MPRCDIGPILDHRPIRKSKLIEIIGAP